MNHFGFLLRLLSYIIYTISMIYDSFEPVFHLLFATRSQGDDVGMKGVSYAYHVSKPKYSSVIGMPLVGLLLDEGTRTSE